MCVIKLSCLGSLVYRVDRVDVTLEMEEWAELAALVNAALGPIVPFPVRYQTYPHCTTFFHPAFPGGLYSPRERRPGREIPLPCSRTSQSPCDRSRRVGAPSPGWLRQSNIQQCCASSGPGEHGSVQIIRFKRRMSVMFPKENSVEPFSQNNMLLFQEGPTMKYEMFPPNLGTFDQPLVVPWKVHRDVRRGGYEVTVLS